jgi:uncharacterized protein YkwD
VPRFTAPLALAASILACTALSVPAEALAASIVPSRPGASSAAIAHRASVGGTHAPAHRVRTHSAASSCRHAVVNRHVGSKRSSCTTTARRATPKKPRAQRSTSSVRAQPSAAAEPATSQPVTIAKVLATPCQNTELTPEPANLPLVRAAVLCLVNTERAQNDRQPLQQNASLQAAAESHGREMIAANYFEHVSPSGVTPVDRVRQTGYIPNSEVGYVVGENLAWGTLTLSTPAAIVAAWIASPEHLANILEPQYRDTGIDAEPEVPQSLAEDVQGALYTQEFGVILP